MARPKPPIRSSDDQSLSLTPNRFGHRHHYLTVLAEGKLFFAPIPDDVKVSIPSENTRSNPYCLAVMR